MIYLLALSIVVQLAAAGLALRLARRPARAHGWLLLAVALVLMAVRRSVTLVRAFRGDVPADWLAELVALAISVLILAGVAMLGPVLRAARRAGEIVPQLLESAPDAMIVADEAGRIVLVNAAAVRLTGYSRAELVGAPVTMLIPERFRARHEEAHRRHVANPRSRVLAAREDLHLRRKDGEEIPIEINVGPLEGEAGRLVVGAIRDVRERRSAELAVRESEGRYRSLIDDVLDNSAAGVCIVDASDRVVWVNRAYAGFFGFDRAESVGTRAEEHEARLATVVEGGEQFRSRLREARAAGGRGEVVECRVLPGAGRVERWLEHRSQPIGSGLYEGGRIEQYSDITERKLAELRIRQFVNIARNMQLGLLVYRLDDRSDDRSLRLIIANPAAERLVRIGKGDMLGRTIDEIFPDLRARGLPALFADVIRTGAAREMHDFEYGDDRVLREIWSFRAFPLPDDSVGVVFEAVTARRRAEDLVANIAAGVAGARGDDFFRSLVIQLARSLGLDYALIGELDGRGRVRVVAFYDRGEVRDDVAYELRGTPCAEVVEGRLCSHPDRVTERFPADRMLADMGVACYVGTPLFDSSGQAIGLIAVLGRNPLGDPPIAEAVLRIFAARAAAELERRRRG